MFHTKFHRNRVNNENFRGGGTLQIPHSGGPNRKATIVVKWYSTLNANHIPTSKESHCCSIHWHSRLHEQKILPWELPMEIKQQLQWELPIWHSVQQQLQWELPIWHLDKQQLPLKLNQEPHYHHHRPTGITTTDDNDVGSPTAKSGTFNHMSPIIFWRFPHNRNRVSKFLYNISTTFMYEKDK